MWQSGPLFQLDSTNYFIVLWSRENETNMSTRLLLQWRETYIVCVCHIQNKRKHLFLFSCPASQPAHSPPLGHIIFCSVVSQSQGCQAGSMRHRLSRLFAAATRVLTLLSPPSNWARLWRRVMMAVTAFWTNDTNCWESMFSGWPAGDRGMDVSSWVFLCHAMISSRRTAFRMPSTYQRQRKCRCTFQEWLVEKHVQ